jgi:putative membrane protein
MMSPKPEPTTDQWRTFFAAERTLLAWIRTGLALMGFGFLVERFGLFLRQIAAIRDGATPQPGGGSVLFGVTLVLLGTAVLGVAARRHRVALNRIASGTDLARLSASAAPLSLTLALAAFGIALAAYLFRLG